MRETTITITAKKKDLHTEIVMQLKLSRNNNYGSSSSSADHWPEEPKSPRTGSLSHQKSFHICLLCEKMDIVAAWNPFLPDSLLPHHSLPCIWRLTMNRKTFMGFSGFWTQHQHHGFSLPHHHNRRGAVVNLAITTTCNSRKQNPIWRT